MYGRLLCSSIKEIFSVLIRTTLRTILECDVYVNVYVFVLGGQDLLCTLLQQRKSGLDIANRLASVSI